MGKGAARHVASISVPARSVTRIGHESSLARVIYVRRSGVLGVEF
jgi:hypothetical protein